MSFRSTLAEVHNLCVTCFTNPRTCGTQCSRCYKVKTTYRLSPKGQRRQLEAMRRYRGK